MRRDVEELRRLAMRLENGVIRERVDAVVRDATEELRSLGALPEEKWRLKVVVEGGNSVMLVGLSPNCTVRELCGLVADATDLDMHESILKIGRTGAELAHGSEVSLVATGLADMDAVHVRLPHQPQPKPQVLAQTPAAQPESSLALRLQPFGIVPDSPLQALFLALHCSVLDLGFNCVAPEINSVPGFAPSLRELCRDRLVPEDWAASPKAFSTTYRMRDKPSKMFSLSVPRAVFHALCVLILPNRS